MIAAASSPPAGGAGLTDIIVASVVAAFLCVIVLALAVAYRRGGLQPLRRLARFAERVSGLPAWESIPWAVATGSLLIAVFGFYWDVSWHIDRGRDPGPFANPAHYFILAGLGGIALAGLMSVVLGMDASTPTTVRFRRWRAPLGGVLLLLCGGIALLGFPLDDLWHRLFGQDVTLWGPTHIQMLGGASLSTVALWILGVEGRRQGAGNPSNRVVRWLVKHHDVLIGGSVLIGLSTVQAEFDYGVPQFRLLYQPVLIMLAAGIALVAVRIRAGRGSALFAAVGFDLLRGLLTLLVGPVLGRTTLHFPLYLVEAAMVELVALRTPRDRPLALGVRSGLLVGTVGLAAEWAWSQVWMPLPWHASLLPEAAVLGFAAGVAGCVLGAFLGAALSADTIKPAATPGWAAGFAAALALAAVSIPAPLTASTASRASVTLQLPGGYGVARSATATVRVEPPTAAVGADWFDITAWQGAGGGDGGLVISPLVPTGPGVYRTVRPFPVHGNWKALIRLETGNDLQVVPVYLPADRVIPAPLVPAFPRFDRRFVPDKKQMQREAVGGTLGLQRIAYVLTLTLLALWMAALAWGAARMRRLRSGSPSGRGRKRTAARGATARA